MAIINQAKRDRVLGKPLKLLVIPDAQVKPDVDLRYVLAIGYYIAAKKPDVVVCLGDFVDFPSLSSYDKGKRSAEGQRYIHDIKSGIIAQDLLWYPVNEMNKARKRNVKKYDPLKVFLAGNHEDRVDRATQIDPSLFGTIDFREDLLLSKYWDEVHEFRETTNINDVVFSHYFSSGVMGAACGTAQQQLKKCHMSCISGHQQGKQTYTEKACDGRLLTSIIAGSCYDYDMPFLGPQGNKHWRGIILLHNVEHGQFDELYVPTKYLMEKYVSNEASIIYDSRK